MKEKITHIRKDNLNRVIEFRTSKNKIYDYETAKELVQSKIIENFKLTKNELGLQILQPIKNNLKDFPEF